ncbi:hypothetical protein [Xylophilus sp.]|uniref:hypothetical protein n=1 Tax=Xylophilus sp. TaxID=2653893 RepID=UPI0013BCE871|nr:hypothetical protein [Xylophilus sp.]KAF1048985.1 MAG: hypothetical protein GAK38_01100 [Xylophilus sp.]
MTLFEGTMLILAGSTMLLLVGFTAREYAWGPALMMLGILGALGIIAYNIFSMTAR